MSIATAIPFPYFGWRRPLIVGAVFAACLGWAIHSAHQKHAAYEAIYKLGGWLGHKERPELVLAIAGLAGFDEGDLPASVSEIDLSGSFVRDSELGMLEGFPATSLVDLSGTSVSDDGLKLVARLSRLRGLNLSQTHITGAGLQHLAGHDRLRWLDLSRTGVGDEAFVQLAAVPNLRHVLLGRTHTTDDGVAEFQSRRPDVQVSR